MSVRFASVILMACGFSAAGYAQVAPLRFNRDIRPVLSDNCFHCHGPDAGHRKAELRLDVRDEALKPSKSGKRAIVPGEPDASEVMARLVQTDPEEVMPPAESHKVLTSRQKELVRQWIQEGAQFETHWAYTPVQRPEVPKLVDPSARILNAVDPFIQQPLLAKGITPGKQADAGSLIRRLSLDLTGLPPAPEDVADFVRDMNAGVPAATEKLIDRLLASAHYGERMAQHWLDVVRYADTAGFHGDQNQNAWAYRDWVIESFNANRKFDEFTRDQLAGDLLPNPSEQQWTATCFNRLTMMTREGGAQPKEYLAKYTADRVRTVGMAWLGATVGCAECHDHKFDPWKQKDFYSLGAFFADVKQWGVYNDYAYTPNPDLRGFSNDHPFPPERMVESAALKQRIRDLQQEIQRTLSGAAGPVAADPLRMQAFRTWVTATASFLSAHPDGWASPAPVVSETPGTATPKKAKGAAVAAPEEASPAPVETSAVQRDGRIVFAGGPARTVEITVPVAMDRVTAVRIELLPDPQHGDSIARTGTAVTLKPVFQRIGTGGMPQLQKIWFADANLKRSRYSNGFEIPGIQDGWTSREDSVRIAHSSVWLFEEPVPFTPGESLRVILPDCTAGSLRVSLSPVIDMIEPGLQDLAGALKSNGSAGEEALGWFLRTAPGEPVLKPLRELKRAIFACRGGRTPVMVTEKSDKPLTIRVLARGNWQDESGEVCAPATPGFLPGSETGGSGLKTRLDLANWLVARSNPLTARVIMNRLWRQLFGTGLSAQVDDLGAQGEAPSHPELLDWLAAEFMDSGWDFRHMVRLIVTSYTYQQAALPRSETRESDPQNRWLASQNARRLEAETVRDNLLAIAGLLSPAMGGPPVKPYQPDGYYSGLQFPDRSYSADTGSNQWRRGIYTHWQRTFLHPMLANFDAPSREDCVAMRTASNTPQQALTLLNDPSCVEAARVWAASLMTASGPDGARMDAAFQRALARAPSPGEREGLLRFLAQMRSAFRERPEDAAKIPATGFAPRAGNGIDPVELAAWTGVCRVILNLHESITRY